MCGFGLRVQLFRDSPVLEYAPSAHDPSELLDGLDRGILCDEGIFAIFPCSDYFARCSKGFSPDPPSLPPGAGHVSSLQNDILP